MSANLQDQKGIVSNESKRGRRFSKQAVMSGFQSLKVRNYRLFIIGQVISLTGTWMQTTAEAWLVLQLSNSPLALGLMTTLQFLPVMILSLYGGVLADHLPKRRTLIVTQTLLLIQSSIFGILVGTGAIQLWHLYLLAVFQGIVTAIDTPVRQAFVAEMVGRDQLVNAVSLNSMTFNGARIIGPAIAGLVISQIGIGPTLYLNALSFIPVIYALYLMRETELFKIITTARGSTWSQLKEGLAYTWNTPKILVIIIVIAAIGTFGYNFTILLPLIADYVLKVNVDGFGALSSFLGLGSLIAALATAYVTDLKMKYVLIGAGAFSILLGLTAITPVFAITAILLTFMGAAGIVFMTTANSLLQLLAPDHLRGRILSLSVLLVMGSTPIGAFLIGLMSEHLGVPAAILTCSTLCLIGVISAWVYQRKHASALITTPSTQGKLQTAAGD